MERFRGEEAVVVVVVVIEIWEKRSGRGSVNRHGRRARGFSETELPRGRVRKEWMEAIRVFLFSFLCGVVCVCW